MRRYLKNLIKILAITFFSLYCFIWILSPVIANYFTNNYALPKGYALTSNSTIRYNPFTAHLTVTDLELQVNKGTALTLEKLDVELHLYQFLFDTIYVAEFDVSGIYIPVSSKEGSLKVAGFELVGNEAQENSHNENETSNKQKFPYEVVLPRFTLSDMVIDIDHFGKKHSIEINSLAINDVVLSEKDQDLALVLSSQINKSPIKLNVKVKLIEQFGRVDIALDIENFILSQMNDFLPQSIQTLDGHLNYSSKFNVELSEKLTSINFDNMQLSIDAFQVEEGDFSVDIAKQQLSAEKLLIKVAPESPVNIDGGFVSSTNNVSVKTRADDGQLATIENIEIDDISLRLSENKPNIGINALAITNAVFSQQQSNDIPALASFKELIVNEIGYQQDSVSVQNITLSGLIANLFLDENKQLSTLVLIDDNQEQTTELQEGDVTDEPLTEDNNAEPKAKFAFSLGEFKLIDNAVIDFKDRSVTPHYERNVNISRLSLAHVDTTKPNLETIFNLQGKSDKYANFVAEGRGFPFATEQSYNLNATLKEVSLPGVSSYIKDALKYEIESGQLDVDVTAGLTGTKINGDVNLLLRGIEFTAADDHEAGTVTDQTSVPFNIALGMLKDSDGNVELSVPLSGDTSSPSFGFSGFLTLLVKQATMSAAKDYLLTTFVPYASVMKVAMAAGEYALKLRINDLNYVPEQIELNDEQLEFSRQMSVMLEDQSDINVKLCAIATPADIAVNSPEEAHQQANIERLKSISQQRVELFKSYMVEKLKVPSAKLLLCTPQVDTSKNAVSRIEFVI